MSDETFTEMGNRIRAALHNRCGPDAACVTLITGSTVEQVLEAFGADPTAVPSAEVDTGDRTVSVVEVPGGVLAVEDGGAQGYEPAVISRLSAGGRAASMYWNDDLDEVGMTFGEHGEVRDSLDNGMGAGDIGEDPDVVAAFTGLDPGSGELNLIGLVATERFCGVRIDAPPAGRPVLVHQVIPHLPDWSTMDPELRARLQIYADDPDGRLAAAIAVAPVARRRVLAAVSARFVAELAGLHTRPELAELLDTLENPDGPTVDPAATDALRRARALPRDESAGLDAMAANVLHMAANPDSRLAAMDATWHAHMLLPQDRRAAFHAAALQLLDAS